MRSDLSHQCDFRGGGDGLKAAPGLAMLSVLLIIVILSITAVPLLELARQSQKRAMEQQVVALLNKEAKEYLEIGIYSLQHAKSFPPVGFILTQTPEITRLAKQCEQRINTIDPQLLGGFSLTDNTTIYNSQVTIANNRRVGQFILMKSGAGDAYERFALLSCATSDTGGLGIYGAEVAKVRNSHLTLSFGRF